MAFVNKLRAYAPKNPPSVSRQSADDFPQIRFSREVSAFAMHETLTFPLTPQLPRYTGPIPSKALSQQTLESFFDKRQLVSIRNRRFAWT